MSENLRKQISAIRVFQTEVQNLATRTEQLLATIPDRLHFYHAAQAATRLNQAQQSLRVQVSILEECARAEYCKIADEHQQPL